MSATKKGAEKPAAYIKKVRFREKYAEWILGIVSFTESSVQPVIVDPFLVTMTLAKTSRWFRFATIATVASVLGGLFGYLLGALFFEIIGVRIIEMYNLERLFDDTVTSVDNNAFLFTLIGAFTPLPYKIVVLVAGFLKINVAIFIVASIIGRAARFYIVAYIAKQFGEYALAVYVKRLHQVFAAVCIGLVLYLVILFI